MHYCDAKTLLSAQNGMNLYRGCTHGCIYCDSRSKCYRIEHAFEDVEVKRNAPALLESALKSKRKRCMIATGSMSDPYMPLEQELRLMRQCAELVERYGFGFTALTKSDLVLRDLDLYRAIHANGRCVLQMTLTTLDESLCRLLEPRVCGTARRFDVLCRFRDAGVPAVVWITPTLPFLNDSEENLRGLLRYCFEAGVSGVLTFGMGVTLREGDREYFYRRLDAHFPGMKQRYIEAYGNAYVCPVPNEARLMRILSDECEAHGVLYQPEEIFAYLRAFDGAARGGALTLF